MFFNNSKKIVSQNQEHTSSLAAIQKGMVSLADVIAPSSVEVDFNFIRVGEKFYKTFLNIFQNFLNSFH